jgi:hypothetical protein
VIAATSWAALVVPVLQNWTTPTVGVSSLVSVAVDALALLGVTLAITYRVGWLVGTAAVFLLLALAFYAVAAGRFDLRQLITEAR